MLGKLKILISADSRLKLFFFSLLMKFLFLVIEAILDGHYNFESGRKKKNILEKFDYNCFSSFLRRS